MTDEQWQAYLEMRGAKHPLSIQALEEWPVLGQPALILLRHNDSLSAALGEFDAESDLF